MKENKPERQMPPRTDEREPQIRIRPMEAADAAYAARIEQQSFTDPWSAQAFLDSIALPYTCFLVAEVQEKAVSAETESSVDTERKVNISNVNTSNVNTKSIVDTESKVETKSNVNTERNLEIENEKKLQEAEKWTGSCETWKIVGYCGSYISCDEAEIVNVAVEKCERKKGIGRQMLLELLENNAALGVTAFMLEVRVSNTPAIALYQSLGFQIEGTRRRFYENPVEDAYMMGIRLPEAGSNSH